jgi:hypothetical protein
MNEQSGKSRSICDQVRPILAAYALGDGEIDAPTRAHLLICPACRRTLDSYAGVSRLLPMSAPEAEPPPRLRGAILEALQADLAREPQVPAPTVAAPANPPVPTPLEPPMVARRATPRPQLTIAALVGLLFVMLGWNLALQREVSLQNAQLARSRDNWESLVLLMNDPQVQAVRMQSQPASGTFWFSPDQQVACLMLEDLPEPAAQQIYQVWLRTEQGWVSAGTFNPRPGNEWFLIRPQQPLQSYSAVLVTTEPLGGSTTPNGAPLIESPLDIPTT